MKRNSINILSVGILSVGLAACSVKGSAKLSAGTPQKPETPAAPEQPVAKKKKPNMKGLGNAMRRARARLKGKRIEIDDKVQFALGKAEILPESHALLDDVAKVLADHQDIKCEVAGHTSSEGGRNLNLRLSNDRAKAVRAYLVSKGIAEARLISKGYGPDQPVADEATAEGKEKNRRVEFRVEKKANGDAEGGAE